MNDSRHIAKRITEMTLNQENFRALDAMFELLKYKSGYIPTLGVKHTFTFLENEFTVYAIWEPDMISILTSYDDEIGEFKKDEANGFRCMVHDLSGLISATAEDVMKQIARKAAPKMSTLRLSQLVNEAFHQAGIRHSSFLMTTEPIFNEQMKS